MYHRIHVWAINSMRVSYNGVKHSIASSKTLCIMMNVILCTYFSIQWKQKYYKMYNSPESYERFIDCHVVIIVASLLIYWDYSCLMWVCGTITFILEKQSHRFRHTQGTFLPTHFSFQWQMIFKIFCTYYLSESL